MKKKGFTLVELLVVIAILAILATVSIVGYTQFIAKSKANVCLQEATQARNLIIADDINNKEYNVKTDGTGLAFTLSKDEVVVNGGKIYKKDSAPTPTPTGDNAVEHFYLDGTEFKKCTTLDTDSTKVGDEVTKTYTVGSSDDLKKAIFGEATADVVKDFGDLYNNITINADGTVVYSNGNGYEATIDFNGETKVAVAKN